MPDTIGNIAVPEITPSGTFPIVPDYPHGRAQRPEVVIHQFGSGNAKIEQRFLLGTGAKRFTVRRAWLRDSERIALRNFWESKYGPYGAFTYNGPNDDGIGTTPYICRFANEPLSWEMVADWACSVGVTLVEIPTTTPAYALNATVTRFPSQALKDALLSQVQQVIPLVKIQPLQSGYPAIHLSDRRCTVGGQLYQARLIDFDGISQGMGNEADDASFTFGNADRVMRDLANDVDLYRASIEFSLFHVGTGIKLDLWKGDIVDWSLDAGPEFKVTASDGLYELNLPYPTRKISRTCWKAFNSQACPFAQHGALDLMHFPEADPTRCDKNYETPNGCLAHGMKRYYGGIVAEPQGVRIKDNSTGVWGFGRSTITSVSLVAESIYDQVLPEIYTDTDMPVNCKIAAGRDESDFYEALGIVGEGPLVAFTTPRMEDKDGDSKAETFVGHTLDGQPHHGWGTSHPDYGLRTCVGGDPAADTDFFSLDQSGDVTGGDWRKVYSGNSTFKDNFAAGTSFIVIRRSDAKGLQLSRPGDHAMIATVQQGLRGWVWTSPGVRVYGPALTNPVWIAVNMLLRARGLRLGADATTQQLDFAETFFDVQTAIDAASICDEQVTKLVGTGTETQFKFRGVIQEEKPLRDWLQEVLMNCLGYYTFAFGKLKIGIRENSSVVEAFTEGNILFRSLELAPLKPSFNHLTANFADQDFGFVNNSVAVYDIDHAALIGGGAGPLFLKSNVNLCGTSTKSQAARIVSVRLREELGGTSSAEWKDARVLNFRTTVLALNTEPGMVCSMTHPDMPGGSGEVRVTSWRLNKDFSIDIQGRTTTDSMYDIVAGPKPADVPAAPAPGDPLGDIAAPPLPGFGISTHGKGTLDILGLGFEDLNNTHSIFAGTFRIFHFDETSAPTGRLAADIDSAATTWQVDDASAFSAGASYVIDRETITVTAADPANNTITVLRAQLGSVAAAHAGPKTITGASNATPIVITAASHLRRINDVVEISGVLGNDAANGNWDIVNSPSGDSFELAGSSGSGNYVSGGSIAGSRLYRVLDILATAAFRPGFFAQPESGDWRQTVTLPNARIVAVQGYLTNALGNSPTRQYDLLQTTTRTLLGGQIDLEVEGTLSIESNAAPGFSMPFPAAVWYVSAAVQEAPTGGPIRITVNRNGTMWCRLAVADGQTSAAGAPSGRALGPLARDDGITLDITAVGTTDPGRRLVVSIRL